MADEPTQPADSGQEASEERARYPGGVPTLGGRQFWGDVCFFRGWRIQQNVLRGHYRLLDPADHRHESGTLDQCRSRLDQIRRAESLPPMSGKAVILIHGLGRSSRSFFGMAKVLRAEGYIVVGFDYPSTRVPIQTSAEYLHSVLQSLEGIDQIDVVCHSMGGLLLRAFLMQQQEPRFHRAVMLGVPNQGAQMADFLKNNVLFKAVLGPAGQQLVTDQAGLISQLPVPDMPFGVIAGGRSGSKGYNPILPGDNDSTVTVASTRLPGATDFIVFPVIHSLLMNDSRCIEATRHFLRHGKFAADRDAEPVPKSDITVIQ